MRFVLISFLLTCPSYLRAMPMVSPNTGAILFLGDGYDSVKDDSFGRCVDTVPPEVHGNGVAKVNGYIKYISSSKELAKSLSITHAANLKLEYFRASPKLRYFRERKFNSRSVYALIHVTVQMPPVKMPRPKINEDYLRVLTSPDGEKKFRERCGDEVVTGMIKGGEYFALLEINTKTEEEKRKLESKVSLSIGPFGGTKTQIKEKLHKLVSGHKYTLFFHQEGGMIDEIPINIDDVANTIEYAKIFAKKVQDEGSGIPIIAITEPYIRVSPNYPIEASPYRVRFAKRVIQDLSNLKYNLLDKVSQLESMLANSSDYGIEVADEVLLNEIRNRYAKTINNVMNAADDCFFDIESCKVPEGLDIPIIPEKYTLKDNQDCNPILKRDHRCGVELYKLDRGEVCGVEVYKKKEDKLCGNLPRFENRSDQRCGIQTYKSKRHKICGIQPHSAYWRYVHPSKGKPHCKEGWENTKSRDEKVYVRGTYYAHCELYQECRHESFGVERYKTCPVVVGMKLNSCRREEFGVERYKECRHPSFGVESFKECHLPVFGFSCSDK